MSTVSKPTHGSGSPLSQHGKKAKNKAMSLEEAMAKEQAPEGQIAEYRRLDKKMGNKGGGGTVLRAAGDAKAESNFCVYKAIKSEAKRLGHTVHGNLTELLAPAPVKALREHLWYSKAKIQHVKLCDMKWTHLLNSFGLLVRAICRKEGVQATQFNVQREFLDEVTNNVTFCALMYEIGWRLEHGYKTNRLLCMSHGQVEHRFGTESDDFFYHEDE